MHVGINAVIVDPFGTRMNWPDPIIADFRSFGQRRELTHPPPASSAPAPCLSV
jgi:hypothetical protein